MSLYYTGVRASRYEAKRRGAPKWGWEHKILRGILKEINVKSVIDAPIGTGRFLNLYPEQVVGLDCSEDMMAFARKRSETLELHNCNIVIDKWPCNKADLVVCIRFLNLINEAEMLLTLENILHSARKYAVFTMRTVPETSTQELSLGRVQIHHEEVMVNAVNELGFDIVERYSYKDKVPGTYSIILCKKHRKPRRRRNEAGDLVDYNPESDRTHNSVSDEPAIPGASGVPVGTGSLSANGGEAEEDPAVD